MDFVATNWFISISLLMVIYLGFTEIEFFFYISFVYLAPNIFYRNELWKWFGWMKSFLIPLRPSRSTDNKIKQIFPEWTAKCPLEFLNIRKILIDIQVVTITPTYSYRKKASFYLHKLSKISINSFTVIPYGK